MGWVRGGRVRGRGREGVLDLIDAVSDMCVIRSALYICRYADR